MTTQRRRGRPWTPPQRLNDLAEFRYRLRRFLGFSEAAALAAGISAQQYQLLQVIASTPAEESSTISYIAGRMLLRHNSAVELVDRAMRSGLVSRVADERDLRRALVVLTDRGAELLIRLAELHLEELRREGPALAEALSVLTAPEAPADQKGSNR